LDGCGIATTRGTVRPSNAAAGIFRHAETRHEGVFMTVTALPDVHVVPGRERLQHAVTKRQHRGQTSQHDEQQDSPPVRHAPIPRGDQVEGCETGEQEKPEASPIRAREPEFPWQSIPHVEGPTSVRPVACSGDM
jgi:hypothetical protein